jgi:group I intron endonuclease
VPSQYYLDLLEARLLRTEYNILQIAGSSLGYKHSEETIAKLKARKVSEEVKNKISERMKGNTYGAALKGRKRSEEVIAKHSERMKGNTYATALKGIKRSEETIAKHSERMKGNTYATVLKGIKRSEETIAKLKGRIRPTGAGTPSVPLEVLDLQTGEKTVYVSMSAFANFLGIPAARIASYFSSKTKKPYKGRYEMRKLAAN